MSVPKGKRKESQFEVFHNWTKFRKEITDLLFRDFGYSYFKLEKKMDRKFGGKSYEEMDDNLKAQYDRQMERCKAFESWFVSDQRNAVMNCIRQVTANVYAANSIYPTCYEELVERRLCQDRALGACYTLVQELQYAIEVLPVDINTYTRFAEMIETEIKLIKGWRKSDNKFKYIMSGEQKSDKVK